jgi:ribosomal protein S18 acetylase RimI-like enzyme
VVTIRALEADDAAAYLAWRGGDVYKNDVVGRELAEHTAGNRVIFVAVDDGAADEVQFVGTVQLVFAHADPELGDGAGVAYVMALWVQENLRGRGIGAGLMSATETEAVRRGCRRLTLMVEPENAVALAMYEKLGYVVFKKSVWVWRGKERRTLCMGKRIGEARQVHLANQH